MISKQFTLALTLSVGLLGILDRGVWAAAVNSVNNGAIVQGGTYYNTADSKTTFTNSGGGGLWLKSGSNLRGLEVDANGARTNNGGNLHFYAPGSAIRLDGNIDVRGVRAGSGSYLGNGGKVFMDAAYLYQNGNIYASGLNGGLVQFNVGAASLNGTARIEAKGEGGAGGVISINASGPVDLQRQVVLDSSGKVSGTLDGNIINIEGGLIRARGNLFANGVESRGGTIRMVATGQSDLTLTTDALAQASAAGQLTDTEKNGIQTELAALKAAHDGDIVAGSYNGDPQPNLFANGYAGGSTPFKNQVDIVGNSADGVANRAGDGGTIVLAAQRDVINKGFILANGGDGVPYMVDLSNPASFLNGGHGGTVSLTAGRQVLNQGRIVADGGFGGISIDLAEPLIGGPAGLIAFSYGQAMTNNGTIRAMGGVGAMKPNDPYLYGKSGDGGLVVFSGPNTPQGNGRVAAFGGQAAGLTEGEAGRLGTIVAPDPAASTNQLYGVWQQTQPNELLTHAENLLLLTRGVPNSTTSENLYSRMISAQFRSVGDPLNALGLATAEVIAKNTFSEDPAVYSYRNLVVGSQQSGLTLDMTHPYTNLGGAYLDPVYPSPLSNGVGFSTLNSFTVVNQGNMVTSTQHSPIPDAPSYAGFLLIGRYHDPFGGARLSWIAQGDILHTNLMGTGGLASGGSVNLASTGSILIGDGYEAGILYNGGNAYSSKPSIHGGSITLKASQDIISNRNIGYQNSVIASNGMAMGGMIQLLAGRDIVNQGPDSPEGLYGWGSIEANGGVQGGIIEAHAGRNLLNGVTQTNPDLDIPGNVPFNVFIKANGTGWDGQTTGRGGSVRAIGANQFRNAGVIQAAGTPPGEVITGP